VTNPPGSIMPMRKPIGDLLPKSGCAWAISVIGSISEK
jgi:hypothetical protein